MAKEPVQLRGVEGKVIKSAEYTDNDDGDRAPILTIYFAGGGYIQVTGDSYAVSDGDCGDSMYADMSIIIRQL